MTKKDISLEHFKNRPRTSNHLALHQRLLTNAEGCTQAALFQQSQLRQIGS